MFSPNIQNLVSLSEVEEECKRKIDLNGLVIKNSVAGKFKQGSNDCATIYLFNSKVSRPSVLNLCIDDHIKIT